MLARIVRIEMLTVLGNDFIRTARASDCRPGWCTPGTPCPMH